MAEKATRQQIVDLLTETSRAHHEAFRASDGEDPDWPIWYARTLQQPLSRLLDADFTCSQLVYCLMTAEYERVARAKEAGWTSWYADHFLERFEPARTPARDVLVLYHFEGCPFCARVRSAIDRLDLDVELRDVRVEERHWDELVAARGRGTVPVLKIKSADSTDRWIPESADIIRYLDKAYA